MNYQNGRGWKYADGESMQAAYAQALGMRHCLQPEAIYSWAKKHRVDLAASREHLYPYNDRLLIAVLNDRPL